MALKKIGEMQSARRSEHYRKLYQKITDIVAHNHWQNHNTSNIILREHRATTIRKPRTGKHEQEPRDERKLDDELALSLLPAFGL